MIRTDLDIPRPNNLEPPAAFRHLTQAEKKLRKTTGTPSACLAIGSDVMLQPGGVLRVSALRGSIRIAKGG